MARFQGTGELAQIDHLAKTESVPANFLAQILGELRNGGLVISKRGIQGGYALAKPADQISLYDIIKVIDGELIEFSGNYDGRSGRRMKEVWSDLRITMDAKAKSYTLDTLVAKDDAEMYHI